MARIIDGPWSLSNLNFIFVISPLGFYHDGEDGDVNGDEAAPETLSV